MFWNFGCFFIRNAFFCLPCQCTTKYIVCACLHRSSSPTPSLSLSLNLRMCIALCMVNGIHVLSMPVFFWLRHELFSLINFVAHILHTHLADSRWKCLHTFVHHFKTRELLGEPTSIHTHVQWRLTMYTVNNDSFYDVCLRLLLTVASTGFHSILLSRLMRSFSLVAFCFLNLIFVSLFNSHSVSSFRVFFVIVECSFSFSLCRRFQLF